MKIGHHPWMKARKYEKTFIIHEWKWENAENRSSSTDEKEKEAEKRSSATAESEKTMKIGFRPWPMSKKQQKQRFGRGRKLQNGKYCVSATADELKTAKADFRPRPKPHCLPTLTHGREQSNLGIASESSNCSFIKQHPYIQRNRSNQVGNICICQEKMRILQLKTNNGHSSALQQHYQQKEISLGNGTDRISS